MKIKNDEVIDDDGEKSKNKKMPSQLCIFILSNSKRLINFFGKIIDGNKSNSVCYNDKDS